ncbi:DUF5053 domain-containing protein [Parabacteroides sp. W1-Q-101]|uniref:DUF5053 domain-containing protein n=1 Tax=Parabacteroides TaxID=375288 RepID=UPI00202DC6A0|nr:MULTISPECIES: DUF5053 domain-containing protein [Parabacteroides]MCM0721604.1 DUF5053 domain-containing protein [Parabacteroides sp. W1-Q-101]
MDKVKRYFELKEQWKSTPEADRSTIDVEMTALMNDMTDQEIAQLTTAVQEDFNRIHKELDEIKELLSIREKLEPVLPYLSVSNLAKDYFGKSSSWFYQRLNGNCVHGKVCKFTEEELSRLDIALKDIGRRIGGLNLV